MVEDKNDSSTLSYADIDDDNNNDDSINTVEKTAKKVVTEIKEALSSGGESSREKGSTNARCHKGGRRTK